MMELELYDNFLFYFVLAPVDPGSAPCVHPWLRRGVEGCGIGGCECAAEWEGSVACPGMCSVWASWARDGRGGVQSMADLTACEAGGAWRCSMPASHIHRVGTTTEEGTLIDRGCPCCVSAAMVLSCARTWRVFVRAARRLLSLRINLKPCVMLT